MKRRDERLEYWDAPSESAWVVRDVLPSHELPGQRLARLTERIAAARGASIETFGSATLVVRDGQGKRLRALEADQMVYLNPRQDAPKDGLIEVGENVLPDVVLEVDHTTDVRGGKLKLYEAWGFAEVWVEVPDKPAPSRKRSRKAGLTIHLLGPDGHYESLTSKAFPGWTAQEVHRAMNEPALSPDTAAALRRVGWAISARPDDDPMPGLSLQDERMEGRLQGLLMAVRGVFAARGLRTSADFPTRFAAFGWLGPDVIMGAALECQDEADFLSRIETLSRRLRR